MNCLRTRRTGRRLELQSPVVSLRHRATGRVGHLVLTAHIGEHAYFAALNERIATLPGTVYFEGVRSRDDSAEHWRDRHHRFLKRLRAGLYAELASLGTFAFQGDALPPQPHWQNADVDCCEFAAELRERGISLLRYEVAIAALSRIVRRARAGDRSAARQVDLLLKGGLLAMGLPLVFEALRLLPATSRFQSVAADWRNRRAVDVVAREEGDFVLVYGAAHGPGLLELLGRRGWCETGREWFTVLRW